MKVKIKFTAINCSGVKISFFKQIECPNFTAIPAKVWNNINLPETSIDEQIIDWYDTIDKKQFMDEMDLYVILDYEIAKSKKPKPTLKELFKEYNISEELAVDLLAVYKEIKPILKNKCAEQKLKILISHVNIGYKAASHAYTYMGDLISSTTPQEITNKINQKKIQ